jgi:hypothetical protein
MRSAIAVLFCLTLAAGASLMAGPVAADPLGEDSSGTPVLPDPVPNPHQVFAKGLANADIGVVSPALDAAPADPHTGPGCTALNPCAVASPALDHVDAGVRNASTSLPRKRKVS